MISQMRICEIYPPRGNEYERYDQMDYFREKYNQIIHDYYEDKGYFELPSSTLRFSPTKLNGDPFTRANRIIFYYLATIRGYNDCRVWVKPSEITKLRYMLLNDELDKLAVVNENGLFDTR